MGHLRGGVVVYGGVAGNHAAKKDHIDRGRIFKRLLIVRLFRGAFNSQSGDGFCLRVAEEEQGVQIIGLAGDFQPDVGHCGFRKLFRVLIRSDLRDFMRNQLAHLLRALADLVPVQKLVAEHDAHSPLPCLRGHSGARGTPINGGFGAAGVVPVYAARRYGLQDVKIHVKTIVHCVFPFPVLS